MSAARLTAGMLADYWDVKAKRIDRLADRAEQKHLAKLAMAQRETAEIYRRTAELLRGQVRA